MQGSLGAEEKLRRLWCQGKKEENCSPNRVGTGLVLPCSPSCDGSELQCGNENTCSFLYPSQVIQEPWTGMQ